MYNSYALQAENPYLGMILVLIHPYNLKVVSKQLL